MGVTLAGCTTVDPAGGQEKQMSDLKLPHGSVVAFYGDSLTSGFGASSPSVRWSTLLCARRNWTEVNPSVPGLGFVHERGDRDLPGTILAAEPDLILVTLGANDLRLVDSQPGAIAEAIRSDFTRLRTGAPASTILVVMPFSPLTFRPPQLATLEGWLRDSAAAIDAPVIESDTWMEGRSDLTVDGVHLTDAGERRIADLMNAAVAPYA
jgi:lysophospholipase L1-like esterase